MIAISERALEDWVCANLGRVVGHDDAVLVARQMQLVSGGILDVLAARWGKWSDYEEASACLRLTVIELKRDCIDEAAVAQVLGYIGALGRMVHTMCPPKLRLDDGSLHEVLVDIDGIVAAPSISDPARYVIQATSNVRYVRLRPVVHVNNSNPFPADDIGAPGHVSGHVAQNAVSAIARALGRTHIPKTAATPASDDDLPFPDVVQIKSGGPSDD